MIRIFLGVVAILLSGCAAHKTAITGSYRLEGAAKSYVLTPPAPMQAGTVLLEHARSKRGRDKDCGITTPEIRLTWKGRRAEVKLGDAIARSQGPVALEGPVRAAGEVALDLTWWTHFRAGLEKRESAGCLGPREAAKLSGRVLESLPVTTSLAYRMRYGNYAIAGYFDLERQFVLKSVAPLRAPDGAVRGYETVYYDLMPRSGGGLTARLRQVHQNIAGKISYPKKPEGEVLRLPGHVRYLRLFFRYWSGRDDRRIAILGTARLDQLDPLTKKFEESPEELCRTVNPREAACISIPKDSVIGPELRIPVNGKEAFAPVGGNISDLLREVGAKPTPELTKAIKVTRLYQGQPLPVDFDPQKDDILRLVLIGGETVTY